MSRTAAANYQCISLVLIAVWNDTQVPGVRRLRNDTTTTNVNIAEVLFTQLRE